MKRLLNVIVIICLLLPLEVIAQGTSGVSQSVSCTDNNSAPPSSILLAANSRRVSYSIQNQSTTIDVYIGFLNTTGATTKLTSNNSFVLKAGTNFTDSLPNVYIGQINCQTTSGSGSSVYITEVSR